VLGRSVMVRLRLFCNNIFSLGDLTGLRKVRDQVLQVKLDRMGKPFFFRFRFFLPFRPPLRTFPCFFTFCFFLFRVFPVSLPWLHQRLANCHAHNSWFAAFCCHAETADSVSGQTVVDPKGYLTDLNSLKVRFRTAQKTLRLLFTFAVDADMSNVSFCAHTSLFFCIESVMSPLPCLCD